MFTGIIRAVGYIGEVKPSAQACVLMINTTADFLANSRVGDSICVQGVCLTATEIIAHTFQVDVSFETIRCTTFSELAANKKVNLELALTLSEPLGGHLVSGHVDGVGYVENIQKQNDSICLTLHAPDDIARYIARKGSICVDGVSLTVNSVSRRSFTVNIIPHTYRNTAILDYQIGTKINLEVDMLARYVERIHSYRYSG